MRLGVYWIVSLADYNYTGTTANRTAMDITQEARFEHGASVDQFPDVFLFRQRPVCAESVARYIERVHVESIIYTIARKTRSDVYVGGHDDIL